jgi:hypothetical protein
MVRPLVHIGYHKTGTSWLQRYLFSGKAGAGFRTCGSEGDAKRELVRPHDLEFDPKQAYAWYEPRFERIAAEGLVPVVSAERLCGDTLYGGHDSARLAERLAATFPDGRVLIVIREQRGIIFSNYQEYVGSGGLLPLDRYLHMPKRAHPWPCDLRHFAYDRLVSHYHRLFGAENVLVLPYELFRRDPVDYVTRIAGFAGASPPPGALESLPFGVIVNRSVPAQTIAAKRRANHVLRGRLNPWAPVSDRKKLGRRLKVLLIRSTRRLPNRFEQRTKTSMTETIRSTVGDYYRASNARTSELIGIDLEALGYDVPASARESELVEQTTGT